MEFKRFEVRKVLRHAEKVVDVADMITILTSIKSIGLRCSVRAREIGAIMQDCAVLEVDTQNNRVLLFSRYPSKIRTWFRFAEIESVDVESNLDLLSDPDNGGRWAMLL